MVFVMLATVFMSPINLGALADQNDNMFENLPVIINPDDVLEDERISTDDGEQNKDAAVEGANDDESVGDGEIAGDESINDEASGDEPDGEESAYGNEIADGKIADDTIEGDDIANDTVALPVNNEPMVYGVAVDGQELTAGDIYKERTVLDVGVADIVFELTGATGGGLATAEEAVNEKGYFIISSVDGVAEHTISFGSDTKSDKTAWQAQKFDIELMDGLCITTEYAPINLKSYTNVELTLNNNKLNATYCAAGSSKDKISGDHSAIASQRECKLVLNLNGTNELISQGAAGLAVAYGSTLEINGEPNDVLIAKARQDGSKYARCAGIGSIYGASTYIDMTYKYSYKSITVNGGQIYAYGGTMAPGIGNAYWYATGLSDADDYGSIIINAGYVETSAYSLPNDGATLTSNGNARNATTKGFQAITINGGSINAITQAYEPNVDSKGNALSKVIVDVPAELDGKVFTLKNKSGKEWQTVAKHGKLYPYMAIDSNSALTAECGSNSYVASLVEADGVYTGTLVQNNESCDCTLDNASLTVYAEGVENDELNIYEFVGSGEFNLGVNFKKFQDCDFPTHNGEVTYTLADDTPEGWASIDGTLLTVTTAAKDKTVTVVAKSTINNVEFTAQTSFTVKVEEECVLDIAKGDIVIEDDFLYIGESDYSRPEGAPIRIVQSATGAVKHTIYVNTEQADISIEDIHLEPKMVTKDEYALLHIAADAQVNLTLIGDNVLNGDAGNYYMNYEYPAIHVWGAPGERTKLTIDGEGSLTAYGYGSYPAIGSQAGSHGDIVINGGRILAVGGKGYNLQNPAPGIGCRGDFGASSESNITINGGRVISVSGDPTNEQLRDIKASRLEINGGSLLTLDENGKMTGDICLYLPNQISGLLRDYPVDKYHSDDNESFVYRTELTLEDALPNVLVTYWVEPGDFSESKPCHTYTDENGKLYIYMPVINQKYQSIRVKAGDKMYYKRLVIEGNHDNNVATLVTSPNAHITSFAISGQTGTAVIDHEQRIITLKVPAGNNISALTPVVEAKTVDALGNYGNAAEYGPSGPLDFTNSQITPVKLYVVGDDGLNIYYDVVVEQPELQPGEKTVLNVANGRVVIGKSDTTGKVSVSVGNISINPNENGYIITGKNYDTTVAIKGNINVPIIFKDLDLANSSSGIYTLLLHRGQSTSPLYITLEGTNRIRGLKNQDAVYMEGYAKEERQYVFDGSGILEAYSASNGGTGSGVGMSGFGGEGLPIIEGGSVWISQAGDGKSAQTVNLEGENTYCVALTINDRKAIGSVVKYKDDSMSEAKEYLVGSDGRIAVYRTDGTYSCTVTFDDSDGEAHLCRGRFTVESAATSATVGEPVVTKVTNKMPASAIGNENWRIDLAGKNLGGNIIVTATGEKGEKIVSQKALLDTATDVWTAYLNIPSNRSGAEYTYTLSVTVDGVNQTKFPTATITMLAKMTMTSFQLIEGGYQIGDAEFGVDNKNNDTIKVTVPYDLNLDEVAIRAVMEPAGATYDPIIGTARLYKENAAYGGERTLVQSMYNSKILAQADKIDYLVTMCNEAEPKVTGLNVGKVDYRGGSVEISIQGENLESLLHAYNYENEKDATKPVADKIFIKLNGNEYELDLDSNHNGKIEVQEKKINVWVPANTVSDTNPAAGMQSVSYPITVSINGKEQEISKFNGSAPEAPEAVAVVVPGEMESAATLVNYVFDESKLVYDGHYDQEANALKFNVSEIIHNPGNNAGNVNINVPWRTQLSELIPMVTLTNNVAATYTPKGEALQCPDPNNPNPESVRQLLTVTSADGNNTKQYRVTVTRVATELEKNANVQAVQFAEQDLVYDEGYDIIANELNFNQSVIDGGKITVKVPWQTNLADLTPVVTLANDEAACSALGKLPVPEGTNPESCEVSFTVTAVSGDTKTYTLTVTRVATDAEKDAEIKDLVFDASELVFDQNYDMTANALKLNQAVIDQAAGTIDILVPWRTKLADITPVITLGHTLAHTLAQVDLVGKLPVQGTENPVTFTKDITVTAVDGTTKTYTLTVTRVATDAEKDATIHAVVIEDMISAEIATTPDEKTGLLTVTVTVNRGLDLSKITPELVLGHQDATYTPQGEQDFSESSGNPIEYVVTAVDGTQLKYGLTIVQKKKSNSNNVKLERTEETREMPAYVTGKDDGNFHPEDVMSRAEAATMLARVHSKFDKSAEYPANYVDVPKGAWYGNYVGFLSEQGVVKGNDNGEFKPAADVTRMEFAAMLARFADLAIDAEAVTNLTDIAGTWGETEVTALVNSGVINGYEDGTFRPNNKLSRAEAVAMVNRMMKRGTTKQELAELAKVSNPFSDIDESHWAYNDVISAVTDYQVYVKTETLGSIHDEWVTVTVSGADEAHENAE